MAESLPFRAARKLSPPETGWPGALTHWRVALNLIAYQAGWLATVYGATHRIEPLGVVAATLVVGCHLLLSPRAMRSAALAGLALLVGLVVENLALRLGLVAYPGNPGMAPAWMLALWPMFATTLSVSLRWFQSRLAIAAVAGAVLGPVAYWAGAAAGAIAFPEPVPSLLSLAVLWVFLFPGLLALARWLEYVSPEKG